MPIITLTKELSGYNPYSFPVRHSANLTVVENAFIEVDTTIQAVSGNLRALQVQIQEDTREPTGFANRTDSTLSLDKPSRTVTLSGTYDVYHFGEKFTLSGDSLVFPDTTGSYFFYYILTGSNLVFTVSTTPWSLETQVPAAFVYWNASIGDGFIVEERHGISMDWATHQRLHFIDGTKVDNDTFELENYVLTSNSTLSDIQPTVTTGIINDEDIRLTLSPDIDSNYTIFYKDSSDWEFTRGNSVPYFSGTTIKYNESVLGIFTQTEVSSNSYVNYYAVATTSLDEELQYFFLQGQREHATEESANSESFEDLNLTGLPFQEFTALYQITLQATGGTNPGGAEITSITRIGGTGGTGSGGGGGVTIHNFLSGRTDENVHPASSISVDASTFSAPMSAGTTTQDTFALIDVELGDIQGQLDNLDANYATDSDLVAVSGNLQGQIDNFSTSFTGLVDTPSSYAGSDTYVVTVSGSGLVFTPQSEIIPTLTEGALSGALDGRYVNVTGDTMTGDLTVNASIYTNNLGSHLIPVSTVHTNELHLEALSGGNIPAYEEGMLFYDGDSRVLKLYNDIPDVALDIGEENWVRIVNKTGVQINNGQVVYINGTQGNRPTVALADKNSELTADDVIGVATHNITNNSEGFITVFGVVREVDTSSWTEGDALYLGNNGALTNIEPLTPEHRVRIGYALNSTNNGQILVTIQNTGELKDLHDVLITSAQDGQVLTYSQSLSAWNNSNDLIDLRTDVDSISGQVLSNDTDLVAVSGNLQGQIDNFSTSFSGLVDTPSSYAGSDTYVVTVSGSELVFTPQSEIIPTLTESALSGALDGRYVNVTGDTMTGTLSISGGELNLPDLITTEENVTQIDDNGDIISTEIQELYVPVEEVTGPNATGVKGQWSYGLGYYYKCVATDTWIKVAVVSSW
jgi:hypothetical protein